MIEPKLKPCEGINKAKRYKGCGTPTLYRTYGLCNHCLGDFLFGNDVGKLLMQKSLLPKAKSNLKKEQKAKDDEKREKLKTRADYTKELQKIINSIVREIDKYTVCVSTLKPLNSKFDAGHFYHASGNPALRFNLNNIYAQSVYANQYLSGDLSNFLLGLRHLYGFEHAEYVLSLKSLYKEIKISQEEIKEAINKAKYMLKYVQTERGDNIFNPEERIRLRRYCNNIIGLYPAAPLNNLNK